MEDLTNPKTSDPGGGWGYSGSVHLDGALAAGRVS